MMKKILTIIGLLCCIALSCLGQNERSLELCYVEHSRTTPIEKICREMTDLFNTAEADPLREVYIYFANADSPILFQCKEENRSKLDLMTSEIMSRSSHEVFAEYDVKRLTAFFDEHDFISGEGSPKYDYVNISFYVNPSFFLNGYTETLISRLAFILELDKIDKNYLTLDVYHPSEDDFEYETSNMFGERALYENLSYLLTY